MAAIRTTWDLGRLSRIWVPRLHPVKSQSGSLGVGLGGAWFLAPTLPPLQGDFNGQSGLRTRDLRQGLAEGQIMKISGSASQPVVVASTQLYR